MSSEAFAATEHEGGLAGPVRRPVNFSKTAVGSIHDDATAQQLGFRGGTVAGNIHMEQFPPLLMAGFGPDWARTGGVSLHFANATTDGEPVQAFVGPLEAGRRPVWMDRTDGLRVCEGTANIGGPDEGSALRQRLAAVRPAQDLRILAGVRVGDAVRDVPSRIDSQTALPRLAGITEPLPQYRDAGLFGERVAAPAVAIDALRAVEGPLFQAVEGFVGMFGAIELQFIEGPVFLDHDYLADGRIVALSESPKTEVVWYESTLRDAGDGRAVAQLIMMSRLLKGSSPLWT